MLGTLTLFEAFAVRVPTLWVGRPATVAVGPGRRRKPALLAPWAPPLPPSRIFPFPCAATSELLPPMYTPSATLVLPIVLP